MPSESYTIVAVNTRVAVDHIVALDGESLPAVSHPDDPYANLATLRSRIRDAIADFHNSCFELGELLVKAKTSQAFKHWVNQKTGRNFETWDEYLEFEVGISTRSANYMMAMWAWFAPLKSFPQIRARLQSVGWKRMRSLIGVADDSNYERWLDIAESMTSEQLEAIVRHSLRTAGIHRRPYTNAEQLLQQHHTPINPVLPSSMDASYPQPPNPGNAEQLQGDGGENPQFIHSPTDEERGQVGSETVDRRHRGVSPPTQAQIEDILSPERSSDLLRHRAVMASDEQWDSILLACTNAAKAAGEDNPQLKPANLGHWLDMICVHFNSTYCSVDPSIDKLPQILGNIERCFGVKLVAISDRSGTPSIVYGTKTLQKYTK